MASFRTFLTLGRVSNLPTVWSNCLAGWLLGSGGFGPQERGRFAVLCLGTTGLYLGGMFLNDAFDAQFDRQRRRERPIPTGAISDKLVWQWGWAWLLAGVVTLACLGKVPAVLALALAAVIVIYDAVHKLLAVSPLLMAACRFLLYLVAASVASGGVTGLAIWSAMALGAYMTGLNFIAQQERTRTQPPYWPAVCLGVPIGLALLVNGGPFRSSAVFLSAVLVLWLARSLHHAWWAEQPHTGRAVAGLLAGIVCVDWLAVADQGREFGFVFIALFLLALGLQRFVPAS